MYKKFQKFNFLVLLFVYSSVIFSQVDDVNKDSVNKLSVNLKINDSDGVIYNSKTIQTYVEIKNFEKDKMPQQVEWSILTDNWKPLLHVELPLKNIEGNEYVSYCPLYKFENPGFYHIVSNTTFSDGSNYKITKNIGVNPEEIVGTTNAQSDFSQFWKTAIDNLEKIPLKIKKIPQPDSSNRKTNLYKIELQSTDGITVRGWLEVPKKKGIYPALLRVPGYMGNMLPIDRYDDLVVFSFNPRNHGESDNTGVVDYKMWTWGLEDKDTYFYKGLYLDCIRAVDFLMTLEEVDKFRIAIWGASQGGGLSFATAALDKRISLCIADIPFMSNWPGYFEVTHWDEIDKWFSKHPDQNWDSMLKTLSYFDTKNMANRITCPVIMGIGLQDDVCPPATSFTTYNLIKSNKQYTIYKNSGHGLPQENDVNRFLRLRELFGLKTSK